ncbi:hypothetical protein ACJJTC_019461 [Scirpophaga incertulas]
MVFYMKENVVRTLKPGFWTLIGTLALTVAMFLLAVLADRSLPTPLTRAAPKDQFIAEIAYEHLLNLTSIGPRVAGTYENEVLGVHVMTEALRDIAVSAAPHNVIDLDLQRASGNFTLTFFDGLNNVYQDVQNVVARARARGGRPERRPALLLNCHIDSVPDSPGASDDAAGCAVALEVMRALTAAPRPLPFHVILLANGAEENIMQGSHAFITQHRWARNVRSFINMEACGAGGREVLFQAGPRDPWLMEEYARSVPYPFASSLAQELFESGLIPSDTDFRIFRDFGNLSGLLWGGQLNSAVEARSSQPVFFDIAGLAVVTAGASLATAVTAATLLLVVLRLVLSVRHARRTLAMSGGQYCGAVARSGAALAAAGAGGVGAAAAVLGSLRALGAALSWYARPWLLGPLALAPALAAAAALLPPRRYALLLAAAGAGGVGAAAAVLGSLRALGAALSWYARPWLLGPLALAPALAAAAALLPPRRERWQPRAAADAVCALWALPTAAGALLAVRATFLLLPWALLLALADLAASALGATGQCCCFCLLPPPALRQGAAAVAVYALWTLLRDTCRRGGILGTFRAPSENSQPSEEKINKSMDAYEIRLV